MRMRQPDTCSGTVIQASPSDAPGDAEVVQGIRAQWRVPPHLLLQVWWCWLPPLGRICWMLPCCGLAGWTGSSTAACLTGATGWRFLRALSRQLHLAADVELPLIAAQTDDFTGADLGALLADAQLAAVHDVLDRKDAAPAQEVRHVAFGDAFTTCSRSHSRSLASAK